MQRCSIRIGDGQECVVQVEAGIPAPSGTVLVERKGWGHPDTLADHLAERLSRVYSRYTLEQFGAVLHHNFDKLALLGGASQVRYGGGRMLDPVRVLVNGRAAETCAGAKIPLRDLLTEAVEGFFAGRLPELAGHVRVELNVTANSSPGAVEVGNEVPDRAVWFAPRSLSDLREQHVVLANDTSLGTGWAPDHPFEDFVRDLVDVLSAPDGLPAQHPWWGSDVKVMGYATGDGVRAAAGDGSGAGVREVDLVACVPQKSLHVPDRATYLAHRDQITGEITRRALDRFPDTRVRVRVNVRDLPERDELYLTWTGSSIESGDEGVVGRGNRINGLITPLRPMNVEGVAGKNPVYHVGKLYNLAAHRLAQQLAAATGAHAEVHLVSATGQRLDRPWRILVRLTEVDLTQVKPLVEDLVTATLQDFPALTQEILTGDLVLS
jgi:S-adenosylmethionine synthetase